MDTEHLWPGIPVKNYLTLFSENTSVCFSEGRNFFMVILINHKTQRGRSTGEKKHGTGKKFVCKNIAP
jgi:hypothetical protein